ncbi:MAG: acetyl-CoA carboxylase biotin carboxyl carrier protein [Alphaproteobacteria bacterium]|nr:acetyl-CoA carboxylase biotin carboxyl carrier protein [Alphaproteobacteria bacterium]
MTQKKPDADVKSSELNRSKFIRTLAELLNETNLSEIEYDEPGGFRLRLARTIMAAPMAAPVVHHVAAPPMTAPQQPNESPAPAAIPHAIERIGVITSPMVGTVYLSSEPGADAFVKIGDTVSEGQTLLIIEAMKVMNPFQAPYKGKVSEIVVKDGQPVEFGEALIVITPL